MLLGIYRLPARRHTAWLLPRKRDARLMSSPSGEPKSVSSSAKSSSSLSFWKKGTAWNSGGFGLLGASSLRGRLGAKFGSFLCISPCVLFAFSRCWCFE